MMKKNISADKNQNTGALLFLLAVIVAFAAVFFADKFYMPGFAKEFAALDKKRIETANRLTTARIIHEDLNHVRNLVESNMDISGQPDTIDHESQFFNFITQCVNDLKLKLVSIKPVAPVTQDRVTTYGYDIEIIGDFFRFGELCAMFENNRRIVSIESFEADLLSENEDEAAILGADHRSVRVKMRVNTYRVKGA